MNEVYNEIDNINYLEINNCKLVISNIPLNFLEQNKIGENSELLKMILEVLYLFKDKINKELIIEFIFDKEKEGDLPKEVSFYQFILLSFYTFINIYYLYNQFVLIKFPQLFPKQGNEINYDYLINLNLSNKEINLNEKKLVFNSHNDELLNIFAKIISQIDEQYLLKDYKLFQFSITCLAGTFDRCHIGHFFLIQTSLLLTKNSLYLGVCSDEMVKHKGPLSLIQSNYVRRKRIEEIVNINGYNNENCKYNIKTIYDNIDMAGVMKDLDCLIVTSETYKGGLICNDARKKNNLKLVDLCTINVIKINIDNMNKISSSILRKEILDIISIEKINKLYSDFKNLCIDIKCEDENIINYWWHIILNNYTKKWKYYHNLNHIYSFIELFDKYNKLIEKEKNEFLLSIFFHDIIYIPSRKDNEKESIKLFNQFYKEFNPQIINKEKVIKLISETENHLLNNEYENDINLFLDMDMQIIAQDNWEDYENKIRKEYCFLDYNIYKLKRKEFLENLNKKDKIFRSNIFYNEYEKIARCNIKNIIKKLNE